MLNLEKNGPILILKALALDFILFYLFNLSTCLESHSTVLGSEDLYDVLLVLEVVAYLS